MQCDHYGTHRFNVPAKDPHSLLQRLFDVHVRARGFPPPDWKYVNPVEVERR